MTEKKQTLDGKPVKVATEAEQIAEEYAQRILELYKAYYSIEKGATERAWEDARSLPVTLAVSSGWKEPSEWGGHPTQYQITLTQNVPSIRIVGSLGPGWRPCGIPRMQHRVSYFQWFECLLPDNVNWIEVLGWFAWCQDWAPKSDMKKETK